MQHQTNSPRRPARRSSGPLRVSRLAPSLVAIACLAAVLVLPAADTHAAAVRRWIPYARNTRLAVPATYQFRFSFWTAQGAGAGVEVWSEKTKGRKQVSRTLRHNLGSANAFTAPAGYAPVDFAQQLYVQAEYRRAGQAAFTVLGGRTALSPAAYALWAAAVADESVPAAGLSAAGAAEGQLLTSVGGKVLWQDPAGAGGGTVSSVAAGPGLTVSATTGDVTVGLDTTYADARYLQTTGGALSGELEAKLFESTVETGTPPLTVISTTRVDNLNADLLDGLDSTAFAAAVHAHDGAYVKAAGDTMTGSLTVDSGADANLVVSESGLSSGSGNSLVLSNPASNLLTGSLTINNAGGTDLLLTESGLHTGSGFSLDVGSATGPSLLSIFNVDAIHKAGVYIEGSLGIGVSPPTGDRLIDTASGAHLTAGVWTNSSDRDRKEAFAPVDAEAVLAKLAALPLTTWRYKGESASVRHLGPMAQDFRAAFGLGYDEKSIATIDADGVALAALQALHAHVEAQRGQIAALTARLEEQRALVERLLAAAGSPAAAAVAAR